MGNIFGFITCTRTKREQDDEGYTFETPTTEQGWVDVNWNVHILHESRNDVRPIVSVDEDDTETLADEVKAAFEFLGAWEGEGGTYFGRDSDDPADDEWTYSYALHFIRKGGAAESYIETPWMPDQTQCHICYRTGTTKDIEHHLQFCTPMNCG